MKLKFVEQVGQIRDETEFPIAYMDRLAHERFPDLARQLAAAPELLAACQRQHNAIDILFAMLIAATRDSAPPFFPSKSGEPWAAMTAAHDLIKRVTGP